MNREFFRSQESGGASQNERLQYHFLGYKLEFIWVNQELL